MNRTTSFLRLPAQLSAIALLAATACGGEDTSSPQEQDASTEEEAQEEAATIPPEDLSGLVIFNWTQSDTFLTFHDIEDGSLNTRLSLQELNEADEERHQTDWSQFVLSPGYRNAVLETDQGLILGSLDDEDHSYTPGPVIAPEQGSSFSDGEITYAAPQFSPDGTQIWFEERKEYGEEDSRIMAVDVETPEAEPEHVGDAPRVARSPDTVEEIRVHGRALDVGSPETVYMVSEDNELEVLSLVESKPFGEDSGPGDALELFIDESGENVVPSNFVHGPDGQYIGPLDSDPQGGAHNQLSLFSLDQEGTVTDDEVLLETEGSPVTRYWYDAESDRLLLQTSEAYYLHTIGDSGEPELAFEALDFGEDNDIAGEADSLGIRYPHGN